MQQLLNRSNYYSCYFYSQTHYDIDITTKKDSKTICLNYQKRNLLLFSCSKFFYSALSGSYDLSWLTTNNYRTIATITTTELLKGQFLQNNLEQNQYVLAKWFWRFTLQPRTPKHLNCLPKVLFIYSLIYLISIQFFITLN